METMEQHYRVTLAHKERCLVRRGDEELYCVLAGSLRYREEYPVVGDYVEITVNPYGDSLIREILPRRTVFCRPDRSGHADAFVKTVRVQPLVSNIDYVFIITSLNRDFSVSRIARYAAMALAGGAIPVAVLTKADACPNVAELEAQAAALNEKMQVVSVSAYTGFGLERLKACLRPGATIALLGSSGAGKSTLINAIAGEEVMQTGEIRSDDGKGRHTTTHRQMIRLPNDVWIIDTPGMREIGMADADEGIDRTFSDILALESQCRFRNCRHETEPGCAVKAAIASGELSRERFELYKNLGKENADHRARKKEISKSVKAYKKSKNRTEE